ncbi:MAG TPA: helix-turn-helix transcriptional regulator [Clostridiales bacterium]|nr:MAG: HTH-type transcriptional regulator ImmR [Firmicutes bacterium ADurb.Bin262]HOU10299.1 helix-turn-helix transcriptional regulator [Clostridiales bacterium]HQH62452.1 helix-turn-helix transcriptional regulator [Clostridiales bacterium]
MEDSFASRMVQLRRESGLSQKDAAAGLLISQALLSHYEKGIRECGLGFVVRAAEFYGVTCDYILGKSANKHSLEGDMMTPGDIPEDSEFTAQTAMRFIIALRNLIKGFDFYTMNPDKIYEDKYVTYFTLCFYRILLSAAHSGEVPLEWLGSRPVARKPFFAEIVDTAMRYTLQGEGIQGGYAPAGMPAPQCVKTFVDRAEKLMFDAWMVITEQIDPK